MTFVLEHYDTEVKQKFSVTAALSTYASHTRLKSLECIFSWDIIPNSQISIRWLHENIGALKFLSLQRGQVIQKKRDRMYDNSEKFHFAEINLATTNILRQVVKKN